AIRIDEAFAPGADISAMSYAIRDNYTSLVWLGGTRALWELGDGATAAQLFYRYGTAARTPPTRSKGPFWAGRSCARGGGGAGRRCGGGAALLRDGRAICRPVLRPARAPGARAADADLRGRPGRPADRRGARAVQRRAADRRGQRSRARCAVGGRDPVLPGD